MPRYEYKIEELSDTGTDWYPATLSMTNAKVAYKCYRETVDTYQKYGRQFRLLRRPIDDWKVIERS